MTQRSVVNGFHSACLSTYGSNVTHPHSSPVKARIFLLAVNLCRTCHQTVNSRDFSRTVNGFQQPYQEGVGGITGDVVETLLDVCFFSDVTAEG